MRNKNNQKSQSCLVYTYDKPCFNENLENQLWRSVLPCKRIGKNRAEAIITIGLGFKEQVAEKGLLKGL